MTVFQCKICGGQLEFSTIPAVAVCAHCGTKQTLPRLDDERRANLYDRANHFRRNNEYDKATSIYELILSEDPTDAEAYWSILLCRYGVEDVKDPATGRRLPTVNRAQFTSFLDDENYKAALANATADRRAVYEADAAAINEIHRALLAISQREAAFDIFLCYKETDENGSRTKDSVLATDLYHALTKAGYRVFFSRVTLEDKAGIAYEPYIFAALHSAKIMVVLGTSPAHFNAVWVRNEWSRFLALIKNGAPKCLIPAYADMAPYDLPDEFSHLQAQDLSRLGATQDLLHGIEKLMSAADPAPAQQTAPALQRIYMSLAEGSFRVAWELCEQLLNKEPENAEIYFCRFLAEIGVRRPEELPHYPYDFDKHPTFVRALRLASPAFAATLQDYVMQFRYTCSVRRMKECRSAADFKETAKLLRGIAGYKDATALARECENQAVYVTAAALAAKKQSGAMKEAARLFETLADFRNASERARACRDAVGALEEAERAAARKRQKRKRVAIISAFSALGVVLLAVTGVLLYVFLLHSPTENGISYVMRDGEYTVTGYEGDAAAVHIPSELKGKPVVVIEAEAFAGCDHITELSVPPSVTEIGYGALRGCTGLTKLTLPFVGAGTGEKDTARFGYIFGAPSYEEQKDYIPERLTEVVLTGGERINDFAFSDCRYLQTVSIPATTTYIGVRAFSECALLTAVHLAEDSALTTVGQYAFENCVSLTELHLPAGATTLGISLLKGCTALTSLSLFLNDGVSDRPLGNYFGVENTALPVSLHTVRILGSKTVPAATFAGCAHLCTVILPRGLTAIEDAAFAGCTSLTAPTLPPTVTRIGKSAFENCPLITAVYIPAATSSVDPGSFATGAPIVSITVEPGNKTYHSAGNCLIETATGTLLLGCVNSYIPPTVTRIASYAFYNCAGLSSVDLPSGLTEIGAYAFAGCTSLESILIPAATQALGENAFAGCTGLVSIGVADANPNYEGSGNCLIDKRTATLLLGCGSSVIPTAGVSSIGPHAFLNCTALEVLYVPANITAVDETAFAGCTNVQELTAPVPLVPFLPRTAALETLTLTDGTDAETNRLGTDAFKGCTGLKTVYLPPNLAGAKGTSFSGCVNITYVSAPTFVLQAIPKNSLVTVVFINGMKIYDNLFQNCTTLKHVTLPDSITTIGASAFQGCKNLQAIRIPQGVTALGDAAFSGCYHLKELRYDAANLADLETDRNIFNGMGAHLTAGTAVTVGKNVTRIPSYLFYEYYSQDRANVGSVTFEAGSACTTIGPYAFYALTKLSSLSLPATLREIGRHAFTDCGATAISFGNTAGWYVDNGGLYGTPVTVTDTATNATYLTASEYKNYTWSRMGTE